MKDILQTEHLYHAAGRIWVLPELHMTELPGGDLAITEAELDRVHRDIANEICGSPLPLTLAELDFLCDLAGRTLSEVAAHLDLHKSTLSRWRQQGEIPHARFGTALKRWFWFQLFGEPLGDRPVSLRLLKNEVEFLAHARDEAIAGGLADPVRRKVA